MKFKSFVSYVKKEMAPSENEPKCYFDKLFKCGEECFEHFIATYPHKDDEQTREEWIEIFLTDPYTIMKEEYVQENINPNDLSYEHFKSLLYIKMFPGTEKILSRDETIIFNLPKLIERLGDGYRVTMKGLFFVWYYHKYIEPLRKKEKNEPRRIYQ